MLNGSTSYLRVFTCHLLSKKLACMTPAYSSRPPLCSHTSPVETIPAQDLLELLVFSTLSVGLSFSLPYIFIISKQLEEVNCFLNQPSTFSSSIPSANPLRLPSALRVIGKCSIPASLNILRSAY